MLKNHKFKKENLNKKKIFKDAWSHETFLRELTFDSLYKIRPTLLKGYGLYPHETAKHIFYSDANRSLDYGRKIQHTFKINVGINKYFESYFKKIMHYPKDKFLQHQCLINILDAEKHTLMKRGIQSK